MILEICANGLQSALNAQVGGANRIELCISLELGGLTPSYGLIKEVKKQLLISVHVLIRPRAGNFIYNEIEKTIMLEDINQCRNLEVAGFVIGALTEENNPDTEFLQKCKELSGNMDMTFHRAFDIMNRTDINIDSLISLGFKRILTSGGMPTAFEGKNELAKLVKQFGSRIEIMAGSGINMDNVQDLIKFTGLNSIHSSARQSYHPKSNTLFVDDIITDTIFVSKLKHLMNTVNNT